jgi:hypothetical protein
MERREDRRNGEEEGREGRTGGKEEGRTGEMGGGEERRGGVSRRRLPKVRWVLHCQQSSTVY